jgi:serine/threonine protein kinase
MERDFRNAGFELGACIARGPLAEVYRAERGGEPIALKVYRPGLGPDRHDARIRREHEAQARVSHRAVARLLDWGPLPDGSVYLASEWIEGMRLEDRLEGPIAWEALFPIACALAEGLGAIHAAGIIHRDLKPSNVMLPDSGRSAAVLLDFGHSLVLSEERLTDRGEILGSASYMAPEQASGGALDFRVDLYALGVMLYRGLCGVLPFVDESPAEVLRQHITEPVVPPRKRAPAQPIPAAAEDLCMWLLAKQPDARLPNARVLAITLASIDPAPMAIGAAR